MQKTAAIVVTTCAVLWLATIAGTVQWLASRAAANAAAGRPGTAREAGSDAAAHDDRTIQPPRNERPSPAQILNEHYGWFMALSLTLGLLVYLPVGWIVWLVMRG